MADPLSDATILVVDDAPESLRFLLDALDREGMRVLIATDGAAALELLDHAIPDLILMDAVMPGLDGFAATRLIKADGRLTHLPIVFMSELIESGHVVEGLEAGGVDYVAKPLMVDALIARLRVHLANSRVARSSQVTLDSTGRPLIAVDKECRILWCTPGGKVMLSKRFPEFADHRTLPGHVRLALLSADPEAPGTVCIDLDDGRMEFTFVRYHANGEWLFLISEAYDLADRRLLAERHDLTPRVAEVLLWISRGKRNREISDKLGISPRTVSKHLQQLFEKLSVNNRASAAAFASRTLSRWG